MSFRAILGLTAPPRRAILAMAVVRRSPWNSGRTRRSVSARIRSEHG